MSELSHGYVLEHLNGIIALMKEFTPGTDPKNWKRALKTNPEAWKGITYRGYVELYSRKRFYEKEKARFDDRIDHYYAQEEEGRREIRALRTRIERAETHNAQWRSLVSALISFVKDQIGDYEYHHFIETEGFDQLPSYYGL